MKCSLSSRWCRLTSFTDSVPDRTVTETNEPTCVTHGVRSFFVVRTSRGRVGSRETGNRPRGGPGVRGSRNNRKDGEREQCVTLRRQRDLSTTNYSTGRRDPTTSSHGAGGTETLHSPCPKVRTPPPRPVGSSGWCFYSIEPHRHEILKTGETSVKHGRTRSKM